jgi:3'(2'), 5'-bisphosphate nucleotidase
MTGPTAAGAADPRGPALDALMRRLARAAGAAIMAVREGGDIGAQAKTDDSPVTRADMAADAVIWQGLTAAFPGVPIVTEERPGTHAATGTHFLVDPLDGTREFVKGSDEFTVNIALVIDGTPVAGVVLAPATQRLFATEAAGGAVEIGLDGAARPLRAAPVDPGRLRAVASASHRDARTQAWLDAHALVAIRSIGSSLKFCLIAAGEADVYPRFGPTMHWDTAAADAILRAAGGSVTRLSDGAAMRYDGPERRNPCFLAAGPGWAS